MSRFVRLDFRRGKPIWVNPDHVTCVQEAYSGDGVSVSLASGEVWEVPSTTVEDVLARFAE